MAQSPCICLQFGMLIAHLFDTFPNPEDFNETAIGDLQVRKYMKPNFISHLFRFRCSVIHCFVNTSYSDRTFLLVHLMYTHSKQLDYF